METSLAICSLIFGGVFQRLPKLRVAFAHGGGSFIGTIGRIEHGFQVRPDLVAVDNKVNPRAYCGRFWVDSLVHDPEALKSVVSLLGHEKVVLGSDYPFPLGEDLPGQLVQSADYLTLKQKQDILWHNAFQFLGRDPKYFLPEQDNHTHNDTKCNREYVSGALNNLHLTERVTKTPAKSVVNSQIDSQAINQETSQAINQETSQAISQETSQAINQETSQSSRGQS